MSSPLQKSWLSNILLLILGTALSLGALELFFRTTHFLGARISWAIADPWLGWRLAPGHNYWYGYENPQPVRWNVNRHGWRGTDWTEQKPAEVYRIALLGDSYVEALQVEEKAAFGALAEKSLTAQTGRKIQMLNFGRSCNTQSEELLILQREILKFNPDMVVLFYFAINDIGDLHPSTSLSLMRPFYTENADGSLALDVSFKYSREFRLKQWINPLKQHSALISLLTERFIMLQRVQQAQNIGILSDDPHAEHSLKAYLSLATQTPEPQYTANYALSKRLLREMKDLCQRRGIRFMLVNIDLPSYRPEVEAQFKSADPTFDPLFFDRDLQAFALSEGFDFIGLEEIFRKQYQKNAKILHFKYWDTLGTQGYWEYGAHTGHWNYAGHQLVAETLTEKIAPLLNQAPDQKK
ncbi:MAG: SGNH/GDSL hydrolase family protein [Candidatus Omnitrophica bacterium]|nr:SGNH/GDSL hydrolase family protein [Candidatus Omnitrophota bacterium]